MNTNWTRGLSLVGLLLASSATTQANDIVDFLNALEGNSGRRNPPVAFHPDGRHGFERNYGEHRHEETFAGPRFHRPMPGNVALRPRIHVAPRSQSRVQFNVRLASNRQRDLANLRPVTAYPQVTVPAFEVGQFIDCPVPLATCVKVEDECNIAPNAIPVVIAVRDPNSCVHDAFERVVFVQIFVPPCPLRNLQISPCRTRICLDYGDYEVDIKSGNGLVVVDYDN